MCFTWIKTRKDGQPLAGMGSLSVVNATETVTEFMYKVFPYLASFFMLCVIAFLILSINGFKKQQDKKEGYKGKLIWAIVLTPLFVIATIFDIIVFINLALK